MSFTKFGFELLKAGLLDRYPDARTPYQMRLLNQRFINHFGNVLIFRYRHNIA